MKITCDKRTDILKRKAKYQEEYKSQSEKYKAERREYHQARRAVEAKVEQQIHNALMDLDALEFEVMASMSKFGDDKDYDVRIRCNEDRKFDDDSALSWSYSVRLDYTGNIRKESSSWSGLNAVTEAQMNSLRQTLEALERINNFDWEKILSVTIPDYTDIVKTIDPGYDRSKDFDKELFLADIEDCIGKEKLIVAKNNMLYQILKQTPTQYLVVQIPSYAYSKEDLSNIADVVREYSRWPKRMKIDNLISEFKNPLEVIEVK